MECAGFRLAEFARDTLLESGPLNRTSHISIVVGKGNNGGDGLVAARHLSNWGVQVHLILACPPQQLHPLSSQHLKTLSHLPVQNSLDNTSCLNTSLLIIDALLGIGLTSEPASSYQDLIQAINDSPATTLSVDVPSGLNASSGTPFASCVQADITLCLAALKQGFQSPSSHPVLGTVWLADIGIPPSLYNTYFKLPGPLFKSPYHRIDI